VATATGAVRSRQDALKRLADVAEFFRKTEPHSPVSYLVQRAVKWGNMPLDNWLQEVIKDENVLGQLRETLGFGGYAGGDAGYTTDSSGSSDSPAESSESSW
jgi:type VI secretion system ImpA family protein